MLRAGLARLHAPLPRRDASDGNVPSAFGISRVPLVPS